VSWKSLKRWVPLFLWLAIIFVGSSYPHLSGEKFGVPEGADKVAHGIEYLVLAFLFYRGLAIEHRRRPVPLWLLVIIACGAIGMVDEFHQQFVPGRDASILDFLADMAGIVSGTLIGTRWFGRARREVREA
jgi:VanZ family protein